MELKQRKPGSGGARLNSGPKKKEPLQKKQRLTIFVETYLIDELGGADAAKSIAIQAIRNKTTQIH